MQYSWYTNNTDKQSPDAIHQTLAYGSLDDIRLLKKSMGEKAIADIFLHYPKKVYPEATLNFIKNFILHISHTVDEQQYLKTTPRNIR